MATTMRERSPSFRSGRWLCAALATALATGSTAPVRAQEEATRIERGAVGLIERDDQRTARRVANAYGRCLARNRMRLVETLLAFPPGAREQQRRLLHVSQVTEHCLGSNAVELRIPPMLMVAAMAEWFLLERHRDVDVAAFAGISDEALAAMGAEPRTGHEDIALCVVRADPFAAHAVIAAEPAAVAEEAAVARLAPHLGPCLPAGEEYEFNPGSIRLLAAIGLYRLVSARQRAAPRR